MEKRTQSLPPAWQKGKLPMTEEPKQGPAKDMAPSTRSLDVGGANFTEAMMRNRPSSRVEQRAAQAPIPTDILDCLAEAPDNYISQTIAGIGSFATEEQHGGGGGNTSESLGKGLI